MDFFLGILIFLLAFLLLRWMLISNAVKIRSYILNRILRSYRRRSEEFYRSQKSGEHVKPEPKETEDTVSVIRKASLNETKAEDADYEYLERE